MTTIGFIGAGEIGSRLARHALDHGYDVILSNSRGPSTLQDLIDGLGPRASAGTTDEAAGADIVVVSTPMTAISSVPVEPLVGKTVIDTNNYFAVHPLTGELRDGHIPELDDETTTTSELLQAHLPGAHVVKAFNHIMAEHLTSQARPHGDPDRWALIVAGDNGQARATVAKLIDEFGFDPLDIGPLAEGWRIQRDTPGYVKPFGLAQLSDAVDAAKRYRDM